MTHRLSRIAAQAASNALFMLGSELENRQFVTHRSPAEDSEDGYDFALTRHEKHYWGIGIRDETGSAAIEVLYRSVAPSDDDAGSDRGWSRRENEIHLTGTNDRVDIDILASRIACIIRDDILDYG